MTGPEAIALPSATAPAFLDYLGADRERGKVWIPAGGSGSVDVLDVASRSFERIEGFKTEEREVRGRKRVLGPSAVDLGGGLAFVGNRATSEICSIDATTLTKGACVALSSPTDGVAYVSSAKEVWVTTPKDRSIVVVDASEGRTTLAIKTRITTEGEPEGYAVDEAGARFFTNLEDKGATLAIDVRTHAVAATWDPSCGPDGPRGLAFDPKRGLLVVACTDHLQVLDVRRDGARRGKLETGRGVDNIDITGDLVVAAAGKDHRLTLARMSDGGELTAVGHVETAEGARNAVFDGRGHVVVADSERARVLVVTIAP